MIGTIGHYDAETQKGYIIDRYKQRYNFSRSDYRSQNDVIIGAIVDFQIVGDFAKEIMITTSASSNL